MDFSRRDIGLLPLLAAAAARTAAAATLPSKTYLFEELPVKANGPNSSRNVLRGETHSGFPIDMHMTELAPGQAPHPPHHHVHEEMIMIHEGTMEVTISGRSAKLGPGSTAYVASNEEHGWRNVGTTRALYFVLALGRDNAQVEQPSRRELLALAGGTSNAGRLRPIIVSVRVLFDQGAHSGKGLTPAELATFNRYQEKAGREFATSGIFFDIQIVPGAYLRTQGYSEIPERFLARRAINVFVTETLGYDIDRDRTGGCSTGPHPRTTRFPPDPFYKTFLGLKDASDATLPHEYAHHFTLDTTRNPTVAGNVWSDLRNDFWLWRQRHGASIAAFRACANSEWARYGVA